MLGKAFASILWAFAIVSFVVWVFLSTDGNERIERGCKPITWTGEVTTSLVSIITPSYEQNVEDGFKKATYTCEFTIWRFFYEEKWIEEQERLNAINKKKEDQEKPYVEGFSVDGEYPGE